MKKRFLLTLWVLLIPIWGGIAVAQTGAQKKPAHATQDAGERDRPRKKGIGSFFKKAGAGIAHGTGGFVINIVRGKPVVAGKELGKGVGAFGKQTGVGTAHAGKKVGKKIGRLSRKLSGH